MKKIILMASGTIPKPENLDKDFFDNSYIIGVDGGINYAVNNGIEVHMAVGDFDSIKDENRLVLDRPGLVVKKFGWDKDKTDLELAIEYALELDIKEIYLLGVTGSRLDHTMINILLLKTYHKAGKNMRIIDDSNEIIYSRDNSLIKNKSGYYISILPTNTPATISLMGVRWPLNHHKLSYGSSYTISNEIIEDKARVDVIEGDIFIFLSRD